MQLSRRDLLTALGLGALAACAGAQDAPQGEAKARPAQPEKDTAAQELGKRKAAQAAANQLGVTQASFERRFAAGMKPL
ncbi:MAG: twin-arginine translocation signal domain-containing protein, partial [Planctomycetota bacterium]